MVLHRPVELAGLLGMQNTPHWFSPINGVVVLYSMHVPGEFTPKH
jgi:hypothetical protein